MNIDFFHKFKDVVEQLESVGNEYASAKSTSWKMQELVSSVRASIQNKLEGIPISKSEIMAKSNRDYLDHLDQTSQAIEKELRLKAKYEMLKSKFEAYRSLCSLEKSTMKEIGE